MQFGQFSVVTIRRQDIRRVSLSLPGWERFAERPDGAGIQRHEGVTDARDITPSSARFTRGQHLFQTLGETAFDHDALAIGIEPHLNVFQPIYAACKTPAVLAHQSEPLDGRAHHCLLSDGLRLEIGKARFHSDTAVRVAGEGCGSASGPLSWAAAGVPLVENGRAVSYPSVIGQTYDLRHAFQLKFEGWEEMRAQELVRRQREIHTIMMAAFMDRLDRSAEERGAAVLKIASNAGLRTNRYYFFSIGQRRNGTLVLLMAHGSLRLHQSLHLRSGCVSAIQLAAGGHASLAYRPTRANHGACGDDGDWVKLAGCSYARAPSALVFVESRDELLEPAFRFPRNACSPGAGKTQRETVATSESKV